MVAENVRSGSGVARERGSDVIRKSVGNIPQSHLIRVI